MQPKSPFQTWDLSTAWHCDNQVNLVSEVKAEKLSFGAVSSTVSCCWSIMVWRSVHHSSGCKNDRLMGVWLHSCKGYRGFRWISSLLRNRACQIAEVLGKRGKGQEQETQDYWLHLRSCYSVWAGHHKNQCHNKQCHVTTCPLLLGIFKVGARHLENIVMQKLIGRHPNNKWNFKDYVEGGLLNFVCPVLKATPTAS